MLKHLDLFSGIGGFSLGLESAGLVETVAFCDFDKYCQKVLKKNFPGVPIYGDVKELNYDKLKADGIDQIDIITGGYPCQPFSVAGRKKGEDDPRHVWPEMFRLIKELRPTWVIGENVGGHIKLGLDTVLENLESEGYSARTFSISATSIGANHKRERVWIIANLADTERLGRTEGTEKSEELEREEPSDKPNHCGQGCTKCKSCQTVANSDEMQRQYLRGQESEQTQKKFERTSERSGTQNGVANSEGSKGNVDDANQGNGKTSQEELSREYGSACGVGTWWSVEPDVGRVAHGIPDRVDRLKCLGNSVVPQIPYVIGLSLKKIIENNE